MLTFIELYNDLWARDLMPCFAVIFVIFTKVCRVFAIFAAIFYCTYIYVFALYCAYRELGRLILPNFTGKHTEKIRSNSRRRRGIDLSGNVSTFAQHEHSVAGVIMFLVCACVRTGPGPSMG